MDPAASPWGNGFGFESLPRCETLRTSADPLPRTRTRSSVIGGRRAGCPRPVIDHRGSVASANETHSLFVEATLLARTLPRAASSRAVPLTYAAIVSSGRTATGDVESSVHGSRVATHHSSKMGKISFAT